MDLTTQCPQCGSKFQARLDELQLRKGYIRCIHCAHIFDGYEAVVPAPGARLGGTEAVTPATKAASPDEASSAIRQRPAHDAPISAAPAEGQSPAFTISTGGARTAAGNEDPVFSIRPPADRSRPVAGRAEPVMASTAGAAPALPIRTRPEPVFSAEGSARAVGARDDRFSASEPINIRPDTVYIEPRRGHVDESQSLPDFLDERHTRRSAVARVFWSLLVLIGLFGILAQTLYVYRVSIASNVPALRPVMEQACEPLHCQIPYPRRIELISIMSSSLQAVPVTQDKDARKDESQMRLQIALRNNFEKPQQWPTLSLDLVEFSGAVVVKKILYPKDYLSAQALQGPFPAKSEMRISVPVTVTGFKINGYQLGKFFP
jgi:predicted Zn finger-like uncharacterized protein